MKTLQPCAWSIGKPLYTLYHDQEWGVPLFEERALFELLCLEGQQAGLSWYTVLMKRSAYRDAFAAFDPVILCEFGEAELQACLNNAALIRHRLKLAAIIVNAKAWQKLKSARVNMVEWLWDCVAGQPQINHWRSASDVPAVTPASHQLALRLKQAGFQFVGPTICYAFMQAAGMVHDHLITCPQHVKNR